MFARILTLLLLFRRQRFCQSVSQQGLPARYMQTTEDAAIWAQVGNTW
jgi:hypothetical protein